MARALYGDCGGDEEEARYDWRSGRVIEPASHQAAEAEPPRFAVPAAPVTLPGESGPRPHLARRAVTPSPLVGPLDPGTAVLDPRREVDGWAVDDEDLDDEDLDDEDLDVDEGGYDVAVDDEAFDEVEGWEVDDLDDDGDDADDDDDVPPDAAIATGQTAASPTFELLEVEDEYGDDLDEEEDDDELDDDEDDDWDWRALAVALPGFERDARQRVDPWVDERLTPTQWREGWVERFVLDHGPVTRAQRRLLTRVVAESGNPKASLGPIARMIDGDAATWDEVDACYELRLAWREHGELGAATTASWGRTEYHLVDIELAWTSALRLVRAFRSTPSVDELITMLEGLHRRWRRQHSAARRQRATFSEPNSDSPPRYFSDFAVEMLEAHADPFYWAELA